MLKNRYKYPRTYHLPYSEGVSKEDKRITEEQTKEYFSNKWIVVTEKLDGENTTLYKDYYHTRSLSKSNHPSQHWLKNFHSSFAYKIPDGWRICGENMYAQHTIKYKDLESYFYVFSIWNKINICLDWITTIDMCKELGLISVPVLFWGNYEYFELNHKKELIKPNPNVEGFVLRNVYSFPYSEFNKNVVKFVSRKFEINTPHWSNKEVVKNGLRTN